MEEEERGFVTGKLEVGFDCDRCGIKLANYYGSHSTIEGKNAPWTTSDFPEDAFMNLFNAYCSWVTSTSPLWPLHSPPWSSQTELFDEIPEFGYHSCPMTTQSCNHICARNICKYVICPSIYPLLANTRPQSSSVHTWYRLSFIFLFSVSLGVQGMRMELDQWIPDTLSPRFLPRI